MPRATHRRFGTCCPLPQQNRESHTDVDESASNNEEQTASANRYELETNKIFKADGRIDVTELVRQWESCDETNRKNLMWNAILGLASTVNVILDGLEELTSEQKNVMSEISFDYKRIVARKYIITTPARYSFDVQSFIDVSLAAKIKTSCIDDIVSEIVRHIMDKVSQTDKFLCCYTCSKRSRARCQYIPIDESVIDKISRMIISGCHGDISERLEERVYVKSRETIYNYLDRCRRTMNERFGKDYSKESASWLRDELNIEANSSGSQEADEDINA